MKLIIDSRERFVSQHTSEFNAIEWERRFITTGDYAFVDENDQIIAVFERKTPSDAASSIRDGRWSNREKLYELRRQTGCSVIFIIEGLPLYYSNYPEFRCDKFIPYKVIESSLIHMMIRDDVKVIWTKSTLDTAQTLVRWWRSLNTLAPGSYGRAAATTLLAESMSAALASIDVPSDITGGLESPETQAPSSIELLTAKHEKSDLDFVREMWSAIKGIGINNANAFIRQMSLNDLINGRANLDVKTVDGKSISRKLKKILTQFIAGNHFDIEIRMLSRVPGISRTTAQKLLDHARLKSLIAHDAETIALIPVGAGGKGIGPKRAERLLQMFNYTEISPADSEEQSEEEIESIMPTPSALSMALANIAAPMPIRPCSKHGLTGPGHRVIKASGRYYRYECS